MADLPLRRTILQAGLCSVLLPLHSVAAAADKPAKAPAKAVTSTTPAKPAKPSWPAWDTFRAQFMNEGGRLRGCGVSATTAHGA